MLRRVVPVVTPRALAGREGAAPRESVEVQGQVLEASRQRCEVRDTCQVVDAETQGRQPLGEHR